MRFQQWSSTVSVEFADQEVISRTWGRFRAPYVILAGTTMTKTLSHRALSVLQARRSTSGAPVVRCVILAREFGTTPVIRKPNAARPGQVSTNASACMDLRATASGVPHGHTAWSVALSKQGDQTPPMTGSAQLSLIAELGNMKHQLQGTRMIVAVQGALWAATVHQGNSAAICAPRCTRTTIWIHPRHAKLI